MGWMEVVLLSFSEDRDMMLSASSKDGNTCGLCSGWEQGEKEIISYCRSKKLLCTY